MRDFTRKKVEAGVRQDARRFARYLAIACILHAIALTSIHARDSQPASTVAQSDADSLTFVEMESPHETASASSVTSNASPETHRATVPSNDALVHAIAEEIGNAAARGDTIAPPIDSSHAGDARPSGSNEPWTFSPTREVNLGLGDETGELARRMAEHGELDTGTKPSPGRVVEGLDAADVARGFGRGGPVVQAVEEVAHDPTAPPEGIAMFDIAIEKNGKISVSVSESTANREDWQRLTADIARAVQKKAIRMPEGANGLRVGVRVEAKIRFPDGRDPKKSGAYASGTGLAVHDHHDGTADLELPSIGVGVRGKVCNADVRLTMLGPMIGGGCSPENIGTHPERTVGATETYEKRM